MPRRTRLNFHSAVAYLWVACVVNGRVSHGPEGGAQPHQRCAAFQVATTAVERGQDTAQTTPSNAAGLHNVFWLHVPKCGTSFGLAILNFACPNLPASVAFPAIHKGEASLAQRSLMASVMKRIEEMPGGLEGTCGSHAFEPSRSLFHHDPLPARLGDSGRGLALLRDPRRRLYSAFTSRHAQGMMPSLAQRLKATVKTPKQYAQFPGIAGCQVKMLVGRQCAGAYIPTRNDLAVAKQRLVSGLGYVGLTDYYDLSVCLLHAMWGGTPRESSFQNARPTAFFASAYNSSEATRHFDFADDPLDAELYQEAKRLFVSRLQEHGFEVPPELLDAGEGEQHRGGGGERSDTAVVAVGASGGGEAQVMGAAICVTLLACVVCMRASGRRLRR
eukprot:m.210407 g.210407  ORF g.210407 m.210407 type:complete len:388 (+) comp25011_c0_seq1:152-1315(+)